MKKVISLAVVFLAATVMVVEAQNQHSEDNGLQKEMDISASGSIRVNNNNRNIEFLTWKEHKVKMVVKGNTPEDGDVDSKLEKMGITFHQLGNNLTIGLRESNGYGNSQSEGNKKKNITIYVPQNGKLNVVSKYANLTFKNSFEQLDLDVTNGNIESEYINTLHLNSKYANFSCNNISSGEIDFINGTFAVNKADGLEMDTKYATLELGEVKHLNFNSTNDEYQIEDVDFLKGSKNYGSFRLEKLNHSFELVGTNADVRIKKIGADLAFIKIDDKYSTLRLPLKNVINYTLNYSGSYSTVTGNFEEKLQPGEENSRFSVNIGSGKGAKVDVKCQNCTVDFK